MMDGTGLAPVAVVICPAGPSHPIHAALPRKRRHMPARLLRFVPFATGSVSDIIGRSIAARLGEILQHAIALMGELLRRARAQPD